MTIQSRPYLGDEDRRRMRELLIAMRAAIGPGCWHIGDLVWRLLLHSVRYDLGQYVRL